MAEFPDRWTRTGFLPRAATVLVTAPLLIGALYLGRWPLALFILGLSVLGTMEFIRLAQGAGARPSWVAVAGAVALPALAAAGRWHAAAAAAVALVIVVVLAGLASLSSARRPQALANAAADVLGTLYVGGLLSYIIVLRAEAGFAAALTVFAVIWANDTMAYLVGIPWGRRRLAPAVSPSKSVEGFVAGLVAAAAVAVAAGWMQGWPAPVAGIIGLVVALAAVGGDLWESAMKRSAGVKDSGNLLPGHGGVLDRFDAVLFGVPVGYYLIRWLL